jgi:hypothetical protein
MLLKAIESTVICHHKQLDGFLSQDQNAARKLGSCPATEFNVLRSIGSGSEGLVLECHFPQSSESVALKLVCEEKVVCE